MTNNWIAEYYDINDNIFHTETFNNVTEDEANKEAMSISEHLLECEDWTLRVNK